MKKLLSRIAAIVLFLIFFGFAIENTQETTLHFFLSYEIRGPLVLVLLGIFGIGAIFGVLAMMPALFRHRRELSKQNMTISKMTQERLAQQTVPAKES